MNTPNNKRRKESKRRIGRAFIQLLQERDLSEITVTDICAEAQVNRTTFYLHYSDQRSVLNDLKEEVCRQTIAMIGESDFSDPTAFVERFLGYIRANDRQFRILFLNDEGDRFRFALMDAVARELVPYIRGTADPQADAFGLAYIMAGSLSIIIEWMKTGYERSPKELARFIFKINDGVKW